MALEIEQPVTENAEARQRFANKWLHRTQVFADHNDPLADALQRQYTDQVFIAVAHIGAVRRVRAIGNPVEPEETHHMVDAQRARVSAVVADRICKYTIA